ncbi:MAG: PAS domain S-box protein [Sphingobacteriales bacterium]|nr:PAS domain S-box protein [Sphingobacteriales bacterium]
MSDFREKYESLIRLASDGCIIYEPGGKILEFNEGACFHLGYTPEEFSQLSLLDLFPEEDLKKRPLRFDLLQNGQPEIDYRRIRRKDGGAYLIELNSMKLADGNIMALATDITEKSKIRKELSMKEHAIESSISGMGITDLDGTIIYANRALCGMWGCSGGNQLLGRNVRDLFEGEQVFESLAAIRDRGIEYGECTARRLNGSLFPVAFSANIVPDGKNRPAYLFGSFIDITEQKKTLYLSEQIIDSLPVIFFMYDLEQGRISRWNTRVGEITGYSQQEIREMKYSELICEKDRTLALQELRKAVREGKGEAEVSLVGKDGTLHPFYFTAYLIRLGDKEVVIANGMDISERKAAEEKLRTRYQQLQLLVSLTDAVSKANRLEDIYNLALNGLLSTIRADRVSVLLFDESGIMQFKASHGLSDAYKIAAAGHSPWKPEAIHPSPIFVPDAQQDESLKELLPVIQKEGIRALGFIPLVYMNRLLGKFMVYFNGVHHFTGEESQLLQTIATEVAFAIGEKENEIALRKSEQQYRDVVDNTREIIFQTDAQGHWTFLNPAWTEILGYTVKESIGRHFSDFVIPGDRPGSEEKFRALLSQETPYIRYELRFTSKEERICWIEVNARLLSGPEDQVMGATGILTDITERKKNEQAIGETARQLRELSAHLQDIREEERTAIAREIHDELGQQLTVLKIDFSWLESRLSLGDNNKLLADKFSDISDLLDRAVKTVRRMSTSLRPSMLDDLGLVATIDWYLADFGRRANLKTEFIHSSEEFEMPDKMRTALFRIFQESVTNVIRHAEATTVVVELKREGAYIRLSIKDNGKGFDTRSVSGKRTLGLLGMKERSLLMGGECSIESIPGMGTTVSVQMKPQ